MFQASLVRMRPLSVSWVLFNEVWYIGTLLRKDAKKGWLFVLYEQGKEFSTFVAPGESWRVSRGNYRPSPTPLAVRQYKSCGRRDSCVVSRTLARNWAEYEPLWDHAHQSRVVQRLSEWFDVRGARTLLEEMRRVDSAFRVATAWHKEGDEYENICVDIMSTRKVSRMPLRPWPSTYLCAVLCLL